MLAPVRTATFGARAGQPPMLPVCSPLPRGAARRLAVGTEAIRQELCQQRWEDGISGWLGDRRDQQHRGKTEKSICRLDG